MIIVIFVLAILKTKKYQHLFLILASIFFYAYSSGRLVVLIIFSLLFNFYLSLAMHNSENPKRKKFYLILCIIGNLGLLGFFKYTNFSIQVLNYFSSLFSFDFNLPLLNIILPIGISFYTFEAICYVVDIYRGHIKPADSLRDFALYISFFPKLVAGPIIRAADFLPQLKNKISITAENFKIGLTIIAWGLVKKVIFADNIAVFANAFFADPTKYPGSIPVFLGALAFGVQIYCDFSGYSDIAIGIAKLFGFNLLPNFDKPYFTTNFSDFWRKWHISLSSWLRDYLYIPLGGNRKGKARTYVNLMITMILGGLWHGAAWNFLLWGFYQGVLLAIHKFYSGIKERIKIKLGKSRLPPESSGNKPAAESIKTSLFSANTFNKIIALLFTQYLVFLGWLLFRVSDTNNLAYVIKKYLSFDFSGALPVLKSLLQSYEIPLLFLFLFWAIHIYSYFSKNLIEKISKADLFYWGLYLFIVISGLYFLSPSESVQFIYFQF